jgi:hypothetical protein
MEQTRAGILPPHSRKSRIDRPPILIAPIASLTSPLKEQNRVVMLREGGREDKRADGVGGFTGDGADLHPPDGGRTSRGYHSGRYAAIGVSLEQRIIF